MSITLRIDAYDATDLLRQIEKLAVQRGVGRFNVDEGAESMAEVEQGEATPEPAESEKPKRKRRTKAEIEADQAKSDKSEQAKPAEAQPAETQQADEPEQCEPEVIPPEPEPEAPKEQKNLEGFAVPTDVDGLRNILRTIASTKTPQAAAGVLTALQYTKVSDVPKEKYAEFAALADKAVA